LAEGKYDQFQDVFPNILMIILTVVDSILISNNSSYSLSGWRFYWASHIQDVALGRVQIFWG